MYFLCAGNSLENQIEMLKEIRFQAARAADMGEVGDFCAECGVEADTNTEDPARLDHVARLREKIVGWAVGECMDDAFVVRTVCVLPALRQQGVATLLVGALLMRARARRCTTAILLTDDHPTFFARHGFSLASLDSMPRKIELSREFQRRFGARTHCMCRRLD